MNENVFRKYVLKNNDEIIKDLKSGVLSEEQYPIIHNLVTQHDLTLNQFEYYKHMLKTKIDCFFE